MTAYAIPRADLSRLAQAAARRTTPDAAAEGRRLALSAYGALRGDDAKIAAFRALMVSAFDMAVDAERRRDVAQAARGAGL